MVVESADSASKRAGRLAVVLLGAAVAAVVGWVVFVRIGSGSLARLLAVVLVIGTVALGARQASRLASSILAPYNVAEVAVEGPITRDGSGMLPGPPTAVSADDVVEQVERANADDAAEALVVKLNTEGGDIVPSEDIRRAVEDFDGPTVAYATDTCASGGYWIAAGCDRLFARAGTVVGSIGIIGSRFTATELADKLGVSYERLAAGRFKDAGTVFRELTEEDREYLQDIIDGHYDHFVDRVTEGRDLDESEVRATEAKVYLGDEAKEVGLVDELGTFEDVEEYLADRLEDGVTVQPFEPSRGLEVRLGVGAATVAYALGAGLARAVSDGAATDGFEFKVR